MITRYCSLSNNNLTLMVEEVKSRYHMGAAQDLKQPMRFSLKFPFIVWPENRSMQWMRLLYVWEIKTTFYTLSTQSPFARNFEEERKPVARLVYIPPPPISPFLNLPFVIWKYTWKTTLTTRSLSDQPWMCHQVRMNVAHRLGSPGHGRGP